MSGPFAGVQRVSRNSMLAKCSGACPTISTAGHTGIPVGTDATNAGLASVVGTFSGIEATTGASRSGSVGAKYRVVSTAM